MKTLKITLALVAIMTGFFAQAQRYNYKNTATVVAQNYDISDNLDLQAVASIFGQSRDLEDFERRLNDPSAQISNLDLNRDNYVDYLRVIEVADNDARVIVIQAVLGQDLFQDVATIELERQRQTTNNSHITVQIVGNPYLYGANYIYEPYYYTRPIFFDYFWLSTYRPYYSPWYWGYYPSYYTYWAPMPIYKYRRHIIPVIDTRNRYVQAETRRISNADRMYSGVSRRGYEQTNPNRSFVQRNENATNRFSLENNRNNNIRNSVNSGRNNEIGRATEVSNTRITNANAATIRNNTQRNNTISTDNTRRVSTDNIYRNSSVERATVPQNGRIERSTRVSTPTNTVRTDNTSRNSTIQSNNSRIYSAPSSSVRMSTPSSTIRSSAPSSSMSRMSGSGISTGRSGGSQRGR